MKSTIRIAIVLMFAGAGQVRGQWMSLLNNPASARSLGMGGVGTAWLSDNAAATLDNPAQLGIFSLNDIFNANTDFHNSLGPGEFYPDILFDVNAFNVGTDLSRIWRLPFKMSVGLGYSNMTGTSTLRFIDGGPLIFGNITDVSNAASLGIGLDYLLRFGLGFSLKWVSERYQFQGSPTSNTAEDFGAIVQVPLSKLVGGAQEQGSSDKIGVKPLYNITVGYAMRNLSGYKGGSAVLPTRANLGWSADAGVESQIDGQKWEWLSVAWSEQADVSPFFSDSTIVSVGRSPQGGTDTTWDYVSRYQKGLGHFSIWRNLIIGKGSRTVGIRKGGQIGFGEFLYIRAGSITDAGQPTYSTFGWGMRLDGLLKCLVFLNDLNASTPVVDFLLNHFELQFDYSRAYGGIYQGKPFEDLNLVVR